VRARLNMSWLLGIVLTGLIVAIAIAQISLAPWLDVQGIIPDLLVATTVTVALHFGPWAGTGWGLSLGISADVLSGHPLGILAVPLAMSGYFSGLAHVWVLESRVLAPVGVGFLGALAYFFLQIPLAGMWGYPITVHLAWIRGIVLKALYSALWAWAFFLALSVVHRLQRHERLHVRL